MTVTHHLTIGNGESVETARTAFTVHALRSPSAIRERLEPHRGYAAYAIGQLAPRLFPYVRCWYAMGEAAGAGHSAEGLVLHSSGGLGEAAFTLGDPTAVDAILRLHRGPHQNFATCAEDHLPVLDRYFRVTQHQLMARMLVNGETFEPPRIPDGHVRVRHLRAEDARTVNRLYNTEGAPTFYSAAHIDSSFYHGVFYDGRLVAVAGTHVVSPEEGVAVVGNVFTHPRYRGRGYATLATGSTTAAILETCKDVVLTVDPRNIPAVRAYWRLGYTEVCRLIEAPVTRRDLFGLGAAAGRLSAWWRGRSRGVAVVR